jgi:hypothetical protein
LIKNAKQNPKFFFKYINSKRQVKSFVRALKSKSGDVITDKQVIANELNEHFNSVFTRDDFNECPSFNSRTSASCDIVDIDCSSENVRSKLASLNSEKATGPDTVHNLILKKQFEAISTREAFCSNSKAHSLLKQ